METDGATMAARLLRVPRHPPPSAPCTPVTSDDLNNPERSVSGKRVKPMRQVVMTQTLQDMVDEMQPVDSMANHIVVNESELYLLTPMSRFEFANGLSL